MITKWTSHIKDLDEAERFKNQVLSARSVLERLQAIFEEERKAAELSNLTLKDFDTPNWDYRQAYKNGYLTAVHFLLKTLDLDHKDKHERLTN